MRTGRSRYPTLSKFRQTPSTLIGWSRKHVTKCLASAYANTFHSDASPNFATRASCYSHQPSSPISMSQALFIWFQGSIVFTATHTRSSADVLSIITALRRYSPFPPFPTYSQLLSLRQFSRSYMSTTHYKQCTLPIVLRLSSSSLAQGMFQRPSYLSAHLVLTPHPEPHSMVSYGLWRNRLGVLRPKGCKG